MRDGKERDPKVTHKIMSAIPSKDTKPEMMLRRELWHRKLRYRVNYKELPGKPDIVFTRYRIAIFCDGDFWHGHNWAIRGMSSLDEELEGYSDFWRSKILRNIARDDEVNHALDYMGWTVIRIWESDIKNDITACVQRVISELNKSGMTTK